MSLTTEEIKALKFGDKITVTTAALSSGFKDFVFVTFAKHPDRSDVPVMAVYIDPGDGAISVMVNIEPYGFPLHNLSKDVAASLDSNMLAKYKNTRIGWWLNESEIHGIVAGNVSTITITAQVHPNHNDGCNCALCKKYCQYAEPNMTAGKFAGKFVCYSCRTTKGWAL